ncbi:hypothetical protein YC2023_016429 [Brassica napus]
MHLLEHEFCHVDQHASVACAETPRAWSIHLGLHMSVRMLLLHARTHLELLDTLSLFDG